MVRTANSKLSGSSSSSHLRSIAHASFRTFPKPHDPSIANTHQISRPLLVLPPLSPPVPSPALSPRVPVLLAPSPPAPLSAVLPLLLLQVALALPCAVARPPTTRSLSAMLVPALLALLVPVVPPELCSSSTLMRALASALTPLLFWC